MGYPTKVQLIKRKASEQWYINFPSAIAQAMEFSKGETVEWIIENKTNLILHRKNTPPSPVKIKKTNKFPAEQSRRIAGVMCFPGCPTGALGTGTTTHAQCPGVSGATYGNRAYCHQRSPV